MNKIYKQNIFKHIFLKLGIFLVTIVAIVLFIPLVFLLSPLYILRYLVKVFAPFIRPDLGKMLTSRSGLCATDDYDVKPNLTLMIAGIYEKFELKEMTEYMENWYRGEKREETTELTQYVVKWFGYYFWKNEENFNFSEHIVEYDGKYKDCKVIDREIISYMGGEIGAKPFKRGRSPWEVILVPNVLPLDDEISNKETKKYSMMVIRVHHTLADGYSLIKLFEKVISSSNTKFQTAQPNFERYKTGPICSFFKTLWMFLRGPFELVEQILTIDDVNAFHLPESKLKKKSTSVLTAPIPVDLFKEIKKLHGVSFTSVIIAAFTGGLRKFMLKNGFEIPTFMHCTIPLPLPGHPNKLRNFLTIGILKIPVGLESPIERLKFIEKDIERLKTSAVPLLIFYVSPLISCLPYQMSRVFFKNNQTTTILTNFPGGNEKKNFMGKHLRSSFFGGGLGPGRCGIGLSCLSYGDEIIMGTGCDRGLFQTTAKNRELNDAVVEELQELKRFGLMEIC